MHDFERQDPRRLVHAEVRVRGVPGSVFNERRQFIGPRFFVSGLSEVRVETSALEDPVSVLMQPLDSLLQFRLGEVPQHRMKVVGTVTHQRLGRSLYLQSGELGLYLETEQMTRARLGSQVEAVGFGSSGGYSPVLRSSVFRITGEVAALRPIAVSAEQVIAASGEAFLSSIWDGRLVQIRGVDREGL